MHGAQGSLNSIPSKQPFPRMEFMPVVPASASRRLCSNLRALLSISSCSMASIVASVAAIAIIPPPNVVPRSFSLFSTRGRR